MNQEVKDADPDTFEKLDGLYAKDKNHFYYKGSAVEDVEPDSIEKIYFGKYFKSDNKLYQGGRVIEDVDAETFKPINNIYAKDKNNIYLSYNDGLSTSDLDVDTFELLGEAHAKDKNGVYFFKFKIEGMDSETAEGVGDWYIKDKNSVYFGDAWVKNADPNSIEVINQYNEDEEGDKKYIQSVSDIYGHSAYAKDKNYVFSGAYTMKDEDVNDFSPEENESFFDPDGILYKISKETALKMGHKSTPIYYSIVNTEWYRKLTIPNYKDYIIASAEENDDVITNKTIAENVLQEWEENGYSYKEGLIFYQDEYWVYGADIESFEVLEYGHGRDKNFAYYGDKQIWGSDPDTFEYLDGGYARDKNFAYHLNEKIQDADIDTFGYLNGSYAKDKNYIYYGNALRYKRIKDINTADFKVLVNSIATDGVNIYEDGEKVAYVDNDTFELINDYYAKDKNNYYDLLYDIDPLEEIDKRTFRIIFGPYATDKNGVYYSGTLIENVKLNPYFLEKVSDDENMSIAFFKQENDVYHVRYSKACKIEDADADTLRQFSGNWLIDANNAYYFGYFDCEVDVIHNIDTNTFEELEWDYAKDKNSVYFEGITMDDTDSETFEILDYGYAKDKNKIYLDGIKLEIKEEENNYDYSDYWGYEEDSEEEEKINFTGFDPDSFELLNRYIFRDKNFVYGYEYREHYNRYDEDGLKIISTEPDNFNLSENIIKTNNNLYIKNPDSFTYISEYLATDGDNIYTVDGVLTNSYDIDFDKIKIIDNLFFTDEKAIYYLKFSEYKSSIGQIRGADIETFEVLGNYYSKDKNNYYYKDYVIKNEIDLDTFEVINSILAKDKNNLYYEGLIIYSLGTDIDIEEVEKVKNMTPKDIISESYMYNDYMEEKMGEIGSIYFEYQIN